MLYMFIMPIHHAHGCNLGTHLRCLAGCGKSLNRDDSPPQGLKPSLVLHDLRGAKAPLYHSAAGFRDFFRSLLEPSARCWSRTCGLVRAPMWIVRGQALALAMALSIRTSAAHVEATPRNGAAVLKTIFRYRSEVR